MTLLRRFIRNDLADLHRSGVRVRIIGERENLDPEIRNLLDEAETLTRGNDKLILVVAFNYGARAEIARAAQRMAAAVAAGDLAVSAVTADKLASYLDAPDLPDPDLIIRTSGEQRLSNFLLWQAAYSELVFVPTYWPDFDRSTLESAITEYLPPRAAVRRSRSHAPDRDCGRGRAHETVRCGGRPERSSPFASHRRLCSRRWRSRSPTSAAGRSSSFGASLRRACCGNGCSLVAPADRRTMLMTGVAPLALAVALGRSRPPVGGRYRGRDGYARRARRWRRPRDGCGSRAGCLMRGPSGSRRSCCGRTPSTGSLPSSFFLRSSGRPTSWPILSAARSADPS